MTRSKNFRPCVLEDLGRFCFCRWCRRLRELSGPRGARPSVRRSAAAPPKPGGEGQATAGCATAGLVAAPSLAGPHRTTVQHCRRSARA
eukprot:9435390-Alexandrium_andersonii.AAC.1